MTAQRSIHLLLILTLAVSTGGCSTATTVALRDDPSESPARARFEAGEPLEIAGYTRISDGHREWKGVVQLAPPDSVRFTPNSQRRRPEFTVLRSDLASIDFLGADKRAGRRTKRDGHTALTIGVFVAVVGAAAIAYGAAGEY